MHADGDAYRARRMSHLLQRPGPHVPIHAGSGRQTCRKWDTLCRKWDTYCGRWGLAVTQKISARKGDPERIVPRGGDLLTKRREAQPNSAAASS